ncbi:MAG: hypothetical protein ABSE59_11530 [Opitutaceae bacterium]|jgi:hypothetical protein
MIRQKSVSLAAQHFLLKSKWPNGYGIIGPSAEGRRLRWYQSIRPHVLCGTYDVELRYVESHFPAVLVKSPDIQALAGDRVLPHTYENVDGLPSLCLWSKKDWNPSRPVASTLIPWTAEWLWFFEHWLVSGEWLGGGTHPTKPCPPAKTNLAEAA